ncbi:MAG: sigma-70 family RNA polymerase sigma factor [Candidatus Binatia bacterium]
MAKLAEQEIQEVAVKYFPLAICLAKKRWKRLPPGREELDDLIGTASLGLVDCLHRYDPSRGTPLSGWVSVAVRGALIDELRAHDLLPQKKREQVRLVQDAEAYLEQWRRRKPTRAEIAALLKYAEEDVEKIMQMDSLSIDLEPEEDLSLSHRPEMGIGTGKPEKAMAFKQAFASLTVEEKVAVRMSAYDATLEDIANALVVSGATAGRRVNDARRKLEESIQ